MHLIGQQKDAKLEGIYCAIKKGGVLDAMTMVAYFPDHLESLQYTAGPNRAADLVTGTEKELWLFMADLQNKGYLKFVAAFLLEEGDPPLKVIIET